MSLAFATLAAYCRQRGYPEPVPEHRFHPSRKWRFDAAFVDAMLAVEFQGGAFSSGRHTRGTGFTRDAEKFATAAAMGWRVMPVTTEQLNAGDLWPLLDYVFAEDH